MLTILKEKERVMFEEIMATIDEDVRTTDPARTCPNYTIVARDRVRILSEFSPKFLGKLCNFHYFFDLK